MPIQPSLVERAAIYNLNLVPGVMLDLAGALAFQTVHLAMQLNLFAVLAEQPLAASELAARLGSHERGTEALLQALAAVGYLVERDGRYTNSAMTEKWILAADGFNLEAALTFWSAVFRELSPQALEVMRTGERPYGHVYAWLEDHPELSDAFQQQLMASVTLAGEDIVKKLDLPATAGRLLDLGGGHGLFSILFCQRHPQLQATVLDSAVALQTAESNIAAHNLTERVHLLRGDLWQEPWGEDYDAILLFNLIHHFSAVQNVDLLRRCHAALKPGGRVAVLDQIAGKVPGAVATAFIRLIALHYFLLADGRVYSHEDLQSWFRQTGFGEAQFHRLRKAPGTSLMVAVKA